MQRYSATMMLVWNLANMEAQITYATEIEPAHLLLGICKFADLKWKQIAAQGGLPYADFRQDFETDVESVVQAFDLIKVDITTFRRALRAWLIQAPRTIHQAGPLHRSQASREVFFQAERLAARTTGVRPHHLLLALCNQPDDLWYPFFIETAGKEALPQLIGALQDREDTVVTESAASTGPPATPSRSLHTPYLNRYGRDLTVLAWQKKLNPIIGRRDEMRTLARVLTQQRKNNAILIGKAGVGKTGIVEGLAQRLIAPDAHPTLQSKRIVELNISSLLAGTKYRGEFEERMEMVLKEASQDDDIVLFIDEIHAALGAGGEGASNAANILKPALARGDIHCIGATTSAEYRQYIEKDAALQRRFQVIWVEEPTREEALEIVYGLRSWFEDYHALKIENEAIEAAVELSIRYLPEFCLPDKAIDLIDQACSFARIASVVPDQEAPAITSIGREEIVGVVAERCRLPIERLTEDEAERLLRMEEVLRQRVIGQEQAIATVSKAVRTARAGLKHPNRPISVFLFAGTTGTGKTELAKALAEFLYGDERRLIRIDMSEYMEQHAVSRLLGAPPGYVGYESEGQLTGPARDNPYSVLLFDEIEKAHPEVIDICLQIFDEGHVTDSHGRRVSFKEMIIILTTNLGNTVQQPPRSIGFNLPGRSDDEIETISQIYREQIMEAISQWLRPELLNRISQILYFYPLDRASVRQIIDKLLRELQVRLATWEVTLELNEAVYDLLIDEGYSDQFGVREMERVIEQLLVQPLGEALLEGRFQKGGRISVEVQDGKLNMIDASRTKTWREE